MGLSTAERNRRKRERKKLEKEERRNQEEAHAKATEENRINDLNKTEEEEEIEIEYVVEPLVFLPTTPVVAVAVAVAAAAAASSSLAAAAAAVAKTSRLPDGLPPGMGQEPSNEAAAAAAAAAVAAPEEDMGSVLRRFHQRAAVAAVVSDDELKAQEASSGGGKAAGSDDDGDDYDDDDDDDSDDDDKKPMSKRKLRELTRPTVADLKRSVKRPDLVEAHDTTAADPGFLIHLKSVSGTVPVPRHWGRKRKYLQGKRGFEKPPFQLPDFIVKTGITEIRDTVADDENKHSAKQTNRSKVNPKMGHMDVDYKTLHEAFFKFQTKPNDLTIFGDLYYEGKEMETSTDRKPGGPFSKDLREALVMMADTAPPPWLINMQRYGPPPSYPHLKIPGLNAPIPTDQCQYGYHTGGWGKPPMDPYGRALYGGNPFDPPGSGTRDDNAQTGIVTSDGKTIAKAPWGMPAGQFATLEEESEEEGSSSSEEQSSDDDDDDEAMEESDAEEETADGIESVLPPQPAATATAPGDLRKTAGDETPLTLAGQEPPKQLYQVIEQTSAESQEQNQQGVFQSDVQYMVPGAASAAVPDGAESVLSKAILPSETAKRKRKHDDEDDDEVDKNFKF